MFSIFHEALRTREAGHPAGYLVKTSCHSPGLEILDIRMAKGNLEYQALNVEDPSSSGQLIKLEDPKIAPLAFGNEQSPHILEQSLICAVSTWMEKLSLGCFLHSSKSHRWILNGFSTFPHCFLAYHWASFCHFPSKPLFPHPKWSIIH